MSNYLDIRFPVEIAFGSGAGQEFDTDDFTGDNLVEIRAERSTDSRGVYDIAMTRPATEIETVKALFLAAAGRLRTFRHRDPRDYSVSSAHIGTGDGVTSTFQLVRPFWSSTFYFGKPVTRPVSTSVAITVNGSVTTAFAVDSTLGIVTLTVAPGSSQLVRATFEYDHEVRFAEDKMTITMQTTRAAAVQARLVEP